MAAHGIEPIDMVVVNLYAFEKTAAQPGVAFGHLIENIDIGGPSMVRSAAKNFEDVAIVTRVADYPALIEEIESQRRGAERAQRAGGWPSRPLRSPLPTTRPSRTRWSGSPRRRRPLLPPLRTMRRFRPRCASTFRWRRRCATARTRTSAPRSTPTARAWASPAHAVAGQGTELQQSRRSGCLLGAGAGVR